MPRKHEQSAIARYLDDIGRYPLLTAAEEIELGKLVQQAKPLKSLERPLTKAEKLLLRRAKRAEKRFVEANLRLVVSVAKRYAARNLVFLEMLDLVQDGSMGLMRAVELFDPSRGYKFSTYAYWWIKQAMTRAVSQKERLLRIPTSVADKASRLGRVTQELGHQLGRSPSNAEVAQELGMSLSELSLLLERGRPTLSLDTPRPGMDDLILGEAIADPASLLWSEVLGEWLDDEMHLALLPGCLLMLEEKEREMLSARYGLTGKEPKTYAEIGKKYGVTRERVRQVVDKASKRLRLFLSRAVRAQAGSRLEPEQPAPEEVAVPEEATAARMQGMLVPEQWPLEDRREAWTSPARRREQSLCAVSTAA
jgi:RNA polymerase primary sigma factor